MTVRNGSVIFYCWGREYDLSAYHNKWDLASDVWFDVWHETNENAEAANDAQRRAEAIWDANS